MPIKSPCISICTLDEHTGLCKGCWRNTTEIGAWLTMSDAEKQAVLDRIEIRKIQSISS